MTQIEGDAELSRGLRVDGVGRQEAIEALLEPVQLMLQMRVAGIEELIFQRSVRSSVLAVSERGWKCKRRDWPA